MDHSSPEQDLLVGMFKGVGVVIALIASMLVAPNATRLAAQSVFAWTKAQGERLVAQLSRWTSRPRQSKVVHVGVAATSESAGGITATAKGRAWSSTASVDERIDALHDHISDVEDKVGKLSQKVRAGFAAAETKLSDLEQTVVTNYETFVQQASERESEAARIDARALPLIGLGIVLNGIPEALASIPLHIGWLILAGSLVATYRIVFVVVRRHWPRNTTLSESATS